jgi:hypothetical protein
MCTPAQRNLPDLTPHSHRMKYLPNPRPHGVQPHAPASCSKRSSAHSSIVSTPLLSLSGSGSIRYRHASWGLGNATCKRAAGAGYMYYGCT